AGISAGTHVVAYDSSGGAYAARLWWLLRYFGHEHASLLDGGWPAWQAGGYPTETGQATIAPAPLPPLPHPEMGPDPEAGARHRRPRHLRAVPGRPHRRAALRGLVERLVERSDPPDRDRAGGHRRRAVAPTVFSHPYTHAFEHEPNHGAPKACSLLQLSPFLL